MNGRAVISGATRKGLFVTLFSLVGACASSPPSEFAMGHDAGTPDGTAKDVATHPLGNDAMTLGNDSGLTPGKPHGCDVSCVAAGGTCANNACTLKENPGALSGAQEMALLAGGKADPSFAFLYPYDKTVFPRGLIPPTLQFAGGAADALLVHITYSSMNYYGFFSASGQTQVQLPALAWTAITQNADASDDVAVAVTKLSGTAATGPITESWSIAQANMRGQIYYETYGSAILGGAGSVGIMSIAPGASKPTPIASGCGNVCHAASADGSTLVSATAGFGLSSISYDLKSNPVSTIFTYPLAVPGVDAGADAGTYPNTQAFVYGGIYPDGTFAMSASHYRTWLGQESHLYDTKTGAQIPANGWDGKFTFAGSCAFSPDGSLFAFNRNDLDMGQGHYLAVASFDKSTMTFSSEGTIATDLSHTLGWPAFTPDEASVVYHSATAAPMGSGYETDGGNTGNVYRVDLATKTPVRLDALDGYGPNGTVYLPDDDADLSFAPTVLPEAVGGYFWVVFTSHRSYGNILPSRDNGDENGKLWVAAIDIHPTPGKDSSHPAFYLDGQESVADNLRGYWVLPPCANNGTTCSAGDECCSGFCRPDGEGGAYSCVPAPTGCSNQGEKCMTASDCCNASAGYLCINGFCSSPPPK
jgi:hypothetical protein